MRIVIILICKAMISPAHASPEKRGPNGEEALPAPHSMAIPSSELLKGQPYVMIEHGGATYWLRSTRSGKLILTK